MARRIPYYDRYCDTCGNRHRAWTVKDRHGERLGDFCGPCSQVKLQVLESQEQEAQQREEDAA
jgi:hypothetical protein